MQFDGEGDSGSLTIAGKGGDWRLLVEGLDGGEDKTMDISYTQGRLTLWDGGDTAQEIDLGVNIPFTPEQVMQGLTEQLTASKIFEEHADEIGRDNIRVEQPEWAGNRRVYNVYIDEPNGEGRVHVLVDADTDLPISMTVNGSRGEQMKMQFQFDSDFDSSLLRPSIPSGVKVERLDPTKMGGEGDNFLKGLEDFGHEMERMHGDGDKQVHVERAVLRG
jgi:hypothetical protein